MYISLAQALGISAITIVALAWLVRAALRHLLDRDLAEHSARLDGRVATELENRRHELSLASILFEKRTALLQERRANVIEMLYAKLVDFVAAAEDFASPIEWAGDVSKEEKAKALDASMSDFYLYYLRHKIYFSSDVCDRIDVLYKTVRSSSIDLSVRIKHRESDPEKHFHAWMKAWETMEKQVPTLQDAISDEFRVLLGVLEHKRNRDTAPYSANLASTEKSHG